MSTEPDKEVTTKTFETKRYTGGCHCGNVRYEASAALSTLMACNCSICSKKGHLLAFVKEEQFTLLSGKDAVTDYQFNTHNIHHLFCSKCGIASYGHGTGADGKTMYSINVRCLDGVDVTSFPVTMFDGKSR